MFFCRVWLYLLYPLCVICWKHPAKTVGIQCLESKASPKSPDANKKGGPTGDELLCLAAKNI